MCYIARSLLYGSFCPLSLRISFSLSFSVFLSLSLSSTFEMRRGDTSTLIVDLTSAIVSVAIGRCFVSSFFSPLLSFFSGGRWLEMKFFPLLSLVFKGLEREIGLEWLERDIYNDDFFFGRIWILRFEFFFCGNCFDLLDS